MQDVIDDEALYSRLLRGELFTTGRYYLAGSLLIEMTPLLQLNPTLFINLGDGSGMLQFIGSYSLAENLDLLAGFNLPAGPDGSEFGGLETADCRRPFADAGKHPVRASRLVFLRRRSTRLKKPCHGNTRNDTELFRQGISSSVPFCAFP